MAANATLPSSLRPGRGTGSTFLRSAFAGRSMCTHLHRFHWLLESVSRRRSPVAGFICLDGLGCSAPSSSCPALIWLVTFFKTPPCSLTSSVRVIRLNVGLLLGFTCRYLVPACPKSLKLTWFYSRKISLSADYNPIKCYSLVRR